MFDALARDERLLLLRFVCAFAWTDLEVQETERAFVHRLVDRLQLSPDDASEVETWLHVAPAPSSVDPKDVPPAHRRTFVEAIRAMMYVDGEVDLEERVQFERLKSALLG
ncbi:MAG TPA: TerB family tellurite resistance protein [Polyangiaceae bacterium]|nr:TerB family tellurite resistance protein [Polyangiaceae bacterium]